MGLKLSAKSDMNQPEKRLLIHAGYHKTGTTFLQKYLFVDHNAGFCLPVNRIHETAERKLSEKIAHFTAGKFAESNHVTALLTNLDLASLGYEMPLNDSI